MNNVIALLAVFAWVALVGSVRVVELIMQKNKKHIQLSLGETFANKIIKTLNNAELLLALLGISSFFIFGEHPFEKAKLTFFIPVAILMIQKLGYAPTLGRRVELLVRGAILPPQKQKLNDIALDLVKLTSLLVFSFSLF